LRGDTLLRVPTANDLPSARAAGALAFLTSDKSLYYFDGSMWQKIGLSSADARGLGWIGLGFFETQIISPSTPTLVHFSANYSSVPDTSFSPDLANNQFIINTDGVYIVNYNLALTSSSETGSEEQTNFHSWIQYPGGIQGDQIVAADVQYRPTSGQVGIFLKGTVQLSLTAGITLRVFVEHNSAVDESVVGPYTGLFIGMPDYYQSYLQITKV
jgi:hypothetical protein